MTIAQEAQAHDAGVRRRVLDLLLGRREHAVIVDSPPGAGKTDLVEMAAVVAARDKLRVLVVLCTNEQVHDLVRRLVADYGQPVCLAHGSRSAPPPEVASLPGVQLAASATTLPMGGSVTVTTVAKAATMVKDMATDAFDVLIFDEAYQVPFKDAMVLFHLAPRRLLVGDPGQLKPLVKVDLPRFEAARYRVHWAAPRELLRKYADLPHEQLPVTWRFPQDTVDFVQPAFYPALLFRAGTEPQDRRLGFEVAGVRDPVDEGLDQIAFGASVVGIVLPRSVRDLSERDPDLSELAARVVERMLQRSAVWEGRGPIEQGGFGYVDAHVASNADVRAAMRRRGIGPDVMANTPEIWQGSQRPIMVVKHTLSGISELTGFDLDPGRLSVMTSRHQLAAVIVSRDGVMDALEAHRHDTEERPAGSGDEQFRGWQAHVALWEHLERLGRVVRL